LEYSVNFLKAFVSYFTFQKNKAMREAIFCNRIEMITTLLKVGADVSEIC